MDADATAVHRGSRPFLNARLSQLFADSSYALALSFAMFVAWALQEVSPALATLSTPAVLQKLSHAVWAGFTLSWPNILLFIIAINVAPRFGARRYVALLLVAVLMAAYCSFDWQLRQFDTAHPKEFLNSIVQALLAVLVFAYRTSARSAATDLAREEIEAAALAADVTRARLRLMRAQIEPHFLFNTLATVRALVRVDQDAAIEMTRNLIRYLSEALPKLRQDESTLGDELQLVAAYLRIHQIRMGSRLQFQLPEANGLDSIRVPTMMLLTLVENALKHGINPAVDGGSIRISADRAASSLVLKVADTGHGMTATEGYGVGLANIRRRLTMLYGDRALLSLSTAVPRGFVATVSIPLAGAS